MASTKTRSFVKALSWRTLSTAATTAFVWLMTGKVSFALGVLAFDVTLMTLLYYIHERAWKNISWGKYPSDWTAEGWRLNEETHKWERP